jgi:hypothetical protein
MYPLPGNAQAGTYISIFPQTFWPFWAECHISPCLYPSLYLYNQVKERNETIPFTEKIVMPEHTYIHSLLYIYIYIYIYIDYRQAILTYFKVTT